MKTDKELEKLMIKEITLYKPLIAAINCVKIAKEYADEQGNQTQVINELAKEVYEGARSRGFFDDEKNIGEMLMLIVTEVAEACEADRIDNNCTVNMQAVNGWIKNEDFKGSFEQNVKDTFEDELADIIIRVMVLAAFKGIDLEAHIRAKVRYNSHREHKHGKRY